jgi:hypothetical protein
MLDVKVETLQIEKAWKSVVNCIQTQREMRDKDQQRAFDLRLQAQSILKGLEDKDLSSQAESALQRLIQDTGTQWEAEFLLKEILGQLPECSVSSRKSRYRWSTETQ